MGAGTDSAFLARADVATPRMMVGVGTLIGILYPFNIDDAEFLI